MKLLFDARWTRTDYYDGISRYSAGVIEGLRAKGVDVTMLICDRRQLKLLPPNVRFELISKPISWREPFIARRLNKLQPDVVFSPLQVMGFWGRRYKLILTLQDVIYYKHPLPPRFLPWYVKLVWRLFHMSRWPQRLLLNRADAVATVSYTSKAFIEDWRLTKRPVSVVYNAPSSRPLKARNDASHRQSVIYIGSFMPYKNVETLIEGMDALDSSFSLHLLSPITKARRAELEALIPPGKQVVFYNGVSDEQYQQLLSSCFCLATASSEEGFGLPIIEAHAAGVPVVCSDIGIFKEVAGNGARYFGPKNPLEFAKQVDALTDEAVRSQVISAGLSHQQEFNWRRSGTQLLKIAQQLLHTEPVATPESSSPDSHQQ